LRQLATSLLVSVIFASGHTLSADGTLVAWSPNTIEGMTESRWDAAKSLDTRAALERIRTAADWASLYEALLSVSGRTPDNTELRRIAEQVSTPTHVALAGTSRLVIWERVRSGDILFEGKGMVVEDDLFRVAGRANWILRVVLKKNFGFVRTQSTQAELDALRQKWDSFLAGKEVAEEEPAYASKVAGLEEIRSPTAIAALIQSLAPSVAKAALTKTCLKNIYGLEEMPASVAAPARFCDPDTYTHRFLGVLTDVPDRHDSTWWATWWQEHQNGLRWDAEKAKFLTSAP
jgi:hypothetical protein